MIEPYSERWKKLRQTHIGASDAPIILGISPWRTKEELLYEKAGFISPQAENSYMRRGKEMEAAALAEFEKQQKLALMFPKVYLHKTIPFMFASIDGVDIDEKVFVEIKCPGKVDHKKAMKGEIPEKYFPQLQHQLEVVGSDRAYYYSYTLETQTTIIVYRDENFIKDLVAKEKEFWEELQILKEKISHQK